MKHYVKVYSSRPAVNLLPLPRAKFIELIDEAIALTLNDSDVTVDVNQLNPDRLRQVARTNKTIDAGSWKCANSCGCPLTAAGYVTLIPANDERDDASRPTVLDEFADQFDSAVAQYISDGQGLDDVDAVMFPVTFRIID
jgi:hypothetical protein